MRSASVVEVVQFGSAKIKSAACGSNITGAMPFHHSIIGKKSWHTGRWDNIVRVKRDEREAQEAAESARRRAEAAVR